MDLLDEPNYEDNFDKWETFDLWYEYGPKSQTSTLKQALQLQTSFWSGSDRFSLFWSKEDSQRRGSSNWIFRVDQIMRTTLTKFYSRGDKSDFRSNA